MGVVDPLDVEGHVRLVALKSSHQVLRAESGREIVQLENMCQGAGRRARATVTAGRVATAGGRGGRVAGTGGVAARRAVPAAVAAALMTGGRTSPCMGVVPRPRCIVVLVFYLKIANM